MFQPHFPQILQQLPPSNQFFWFTIWKQLLTFLSVFAYFFERTKTCFFLSQPKYFFFFSSKSKFRFVTTFLFLNPYHHIMCILYFQKQYSNKLAPEYFCSALWKQRNKNNFLVLKFSSSAKINGVSNKIDFWPSSRITKSNGFWFWANALLQPHFCKI